MDNNFLYINIYFHNVAPSVIVEDDDGFLHSEVGIDKDLERLLADDPGLYMEDTSNIHNKPRLEVRSVDRAGNAPYTADITSPIPKRYFFTDKCRSFALNLINLQL